MVTVRIKGGLGNQLFQYAAGYSLSKRLGQDLSCDVAFTDNMTIRGFKLPLLNVQVNKDEGLFSAQKKIKLIKNPYINKIYRVINSDIHKVNGGIYWLETKETYLSEFNVISADNIYIDGYFQTPQYFQINRNELLKQITPNYTAEPEYVRFLNQIRNSNAVAVHVRRSDFKKDNNKFHYLLDKKYYLKALEYIDRKIENPIFYWFSDDIEWVVQNMGNRPEYKYVQLKTTHEDIDEMMLMKNCKHIIAANSSFSWWAAWLNSGNNPIIVVPKRQYGNDRMIPETWIKI